MIITVDFDGTLYQHNSVITMLKVGKTMFTFKQWFYVAKDIVKGITNKIIRGEKDFRILFFLNLFFFK